ncbi:transcriptional regulator LicR [Alkalibacterium iburiense]|uniref:Transcriptional regulator LicR n=1 Tax=Alkalibacterium iburiense TaxID=290589 RepID=A0ABN0X2M0_9LACT
MERRLEIILKEFMRSTSSVTSQYLSQVLEVSSRTIRDDIKELNQALSDYGTHIKSTRGIGYHLVVEDDEAFRQFLNSQSKSQLPNSSDERIQYILNTLLLADDYIKLDDLADEIHVSKSTLQMDLKAIRAILNNYSLTLNSLPNYGLKIEGEELNRRFAISEYSFNRSDKGPDLVWLDQLAKIVHSDRETLMTIWQLLIRQLGENTVTLSDIAMNNLFVHIAIAYKRINKGHHIDLIPQDLKEIERQSEYTVALSIIKEIEKAWDVHFPANEIAYITIHLMGTRMVNKANLSEDDVDDIMDKQVRKMALKMLDSIDEELNLGIKEDKELLIGLCLHLKPAMNRFKYGMNIRNPMLEDIKSNYPLAFEAALIASLVLDSELNISIDENEVAYLALHIGAAIVRKKADNTPKRCYIVCASGVGSAQLIRYRIESEFRTQIQVVGMSEYYKIQSIPFDSIDFIISSVPVSETLPVPVIEVGAILGDSDLMKIEKHVQSSQNKIRDYIPQENTYLNQAFTTKEEVIEFLSDQAQKKDDLPENYVDLVYEREAIAPTSYGNLVAIPHPIRPLASRTYLTICTLKKPINWEDRKVQFVCLLNVEKNSQDNLQDMYDMLGRIVNDPDLIQQLIQAQDYQSFLSTILKNS